MIQVISLFLVGALGFQGSLSSDITGIAMLAIPQRERVSEEEKKKDLNIPSRQFRNLTQNG